MEIIDDKALLFRTRNPSKYSVLPKHKVLSTEGEISEVLVRWGLDEVRVLRNLGVKNAPSPITRKYDWPGRFKPMEHQVETAAFLTINRRAFCFNDPGTGKTLSALWAADYLMKRKEVRRVLVLCPLSIMHSAWMQDLSSSVIHRTAVVCHHTQGPKRIDMVKNGYEFVITNFDGLNLIAPAIKEDGTFDLIIVDECSSYQNPSTRRWKTLASIVKPNTFLWMMTGTPSAQSPIGAYGLARLVNPNGVPAYKTAWRDQVMNKLTDFKWVAKHTAKDTVYQALQPAIRYTKAQCLDLPPVVTVTREVPMSTQQAKYYKLIKEQMLANVVGATITAVNAGVALSKLLQVSAGAAITDTQEVVEFDCAPRMSVLEEILEETDRKVLIFAMFRASIDTIVTHLTKQGYAAAQIHGGVSAGHRGEIIRDFQTTDKIKVLVMQPQSTAHGITLTAADTVVFYGPLMSVEQYIQAIARADRKGQDAEKVTVIHIESSPVEKKLFKALAGKVDENVLLTDLFLSEVKN